MNPPVNPLVNRSVDVRGELAAPDLPARLAALGFEPDDAAQAVAAAAATLERPDRMAVVEQAAERLVSRTGILPAGDGMEVWDGLDVGPDGVLALLALLATAPAVARLHASRGVPADVSVATLADLGHQVRVHRLVFGRFGLETYGWVAGFAWAGNLYRLGRLQLDLEPMDTLDGTGREWVLSTHIPRGGRFAPEDVDASLRAAPAFFARHFGEVAVTSIHCHSWMLDPRLPTLLPGSNLASFQQRWRTYGEPHDGDVDALFFAFTHRGPLDPATLTAGTSLQRALLSVWREGGHWRLVHGRLAGGLPS